MTAMKLASILASAAALAVVSGGAAFSSRPEGPGPEPRVNAWEQQLVLPQKLSSRLTWSERHLRPSGRRKLEEIGRRLAADIAAGADAQSLRSRARQDVAAAFPGLAGMDVTEAAFIVMAMATKDMDDDIRMIMVEIRAMTAAKQKLRELIKELNGWISQEMSKHAESEDINNEKAAGSSTTSRAARPATKTPPVPARRMTLETRTSPVIHLEYVKAPAIPPLPPRNPGLTVSGLKSLLDDIQGNLDGMNEMSETTSLRLQMTMDRRTKIIQTLSNMMKKLGSSQERLVQNIK
jgi:uncharacterized spore protein YtfJ